MEWNSYFKHFRANILFLLVTYKITIELEPGNCNRDHDKTRIKPGLLVAQSCKETCDLKRFDFKRS